jgi:hypothetical protein
MSAPRLVLKQSSGWFAAGWQFGEALVQLSDAGFKLYAWMCLNAERHTGRLRISVPSLASALQKPAPWVHATLEELVRQEVCRWTPPDLLEVRDRYWPYEKQPCRERPPEFIAEVRHLLAQPACVRCAFTAADERLARDLEKRGISLEQLERAIWLGCARKYAAMLNGQPPAPITSLRYFLALIEEVGQARTPDSYWQHVRSRAAVLQRQWLERHGRATVPAD